MLTNASTLSVDYENKIFYVVPDGYGGGRTMRVLDLVKQLLALHTSAKELPASNVLKDHRRQLAVAASC